MEKYKVTGNGTKASFHNACNLETFRDVTLKHIVVDPKEGVPALFIKEISLIKELNHVNILRPFEVLTATDKISVVLVYENMDIDLRRFIYDNEAIKNPRTIKDFLRQILSAVSFYHSYNVVHGGVKPENIFINRATNNLKLTDFIWPRTLRNTAAGDPNEDSSHNYKAPETLVQHKEFSTAVDVWSVGCIFAEMVNRKTLFHAQTDFHQLNKIFSIMGTPSEETWPGITEVFPCLHSFDKIPTKDLKTIVPGLEPAGIDLLSKLIYVDPKRRITASKALEHEYFHD